MAHFQQLHPQFEILLVGVLVRLGGGSNPRLLLAPICRLSLEELGTDRPVDLVLVSGLDAVLECVVPSPQPVECLPVVCPLFLVALAQDPGDLLPDGFVAEPQPSDEPVELRCQFLLAHVWLGAFALRAGTVVVDVASLLQFAHDGAPAVSAAEQSREREVLRPASSPTVQMLGQHLLRPVPHIPWDQRLMDAVVDVPLPFELPGVDPVVQDLRHRRRVNR